MRLGPLPLLAALLACAPDSAREAAAPAWLAEPVATIGTDSGVSSFASVRSLLFSPAGELLVVDQRERQVKLFDSTGRFLRLLGRSGAGPGEYSDPYSVAWLHDTLALLDPGNSRIGLFDGTGAWLGTLPVQPISGGSDIRLYRTPPSAFWAYGYKAVGQQLQGLFIRYSSAGPQDTIPYFRHPPSGTTAITCEFPDRSLHFFDAPFAPADLQIPTAAGERAIARTDRYRIDLIGPAGDTLRTITRTEVGAPISDAEWEGGLDGWSAVRTNTPAAKCDAEGFDRPAAKPILSAIFLDPAGRLWVEVRGATAPRYDVYDTTGSLVASVTGLPSSGEIDPAFLDDRIAIALPADDGFPRIGIYRISMETK